MARVRVQGKAGRSGAPATSSGAVSHAAGLADVVRGNGAGAAERVVFQHAGRVAPGRPQHAEPAPDESVSRPFSALHPRAVLPLQIHDARRAPAEWSVVEPSADRDVLRTGLARQPVTNHRRPWFKVRDAGFEDCVLDSTMDYGPSTM